MAGAGLNRVSLLGNLGTDPEVRTTAKEISVCRFRLATSERRKTAEGWADHTEWHNIVAFGRTAEKCREFLRKGRQVYVEGSLRTRAWQDDEGQPRHATEIVTRSVQFIGEKGRQTHADESDEVGSGDVIPDMEDDIPW
jgi:single-strand DNA-binding protein